MRYTMMLCIALFCSVAIHAQYIQPASGGGTINGGAVQWNTGSFQNAQPVASYAIGYQIANGGSGTGTENPADTVAGDTTISSLIPAYVKDIHVTDNTLLVGQSISVELFTVKGRRVAHYAAGNSRISLAHLPMGTYIAKIHQTGEQKTYSISINKY